MFRLPTALLAFVVVMGGSVSTAYGFEVVLSGATQRGHDFARYEAFAVITVSFERWLTPTPRTVEALAQTATQPSATQPSATQPSASQPSATQPPVDEAPADRAPPVPRRAAGRSRAAAQVPRFDATFLRALAHACGRDFRTAASELTQLSSRARSSAWLPELRLRGGRNTDQTLRLTPTEAEPDRYQLAGGDDYRYEGQVRWDFSRLVFAADELAVSRMRRTLELEQRKRQQQAITTLGKWLLAWVQLANPALLEEEQLNAWVAERTFRAELDWLTHGWFSEQVSPGPQLSGLTSE